MSVALDDDDAARMEIAQVRVLGITVEKLKSFDQALNASERQFVNAVDLQLNVFRKMVPRDQVQRIKDLAWKFRRNMPAHLAPKLPPHDPIVQEMETRDG